MIKPVKIRKRNASSVFEENTPRGATGIIPARKHRTVISRMLTESSSINLTDFDAFEEEYIAGLGTELAVLIDTLQWEPAPVTVRTTQGEETLFQTPRGGVIANLSKGTIKPADSDAPDMLALTCMVYAFETNRSAIKGIAPLEVEHAFTDMCLGLISKGRRKQDIGDLDRVLP